MHKPHSLHFLAAFALLMLCCHFHFVVNDDTYTGLMLSWYIVAALFLVSRYRNGEMAYEGLH